MIGGYRMCTVGCAYSARCVRTVGARRAYGARTVRVRCAYGARTVRVRCAQCVHGARATRVRCARGARTARAMPHPVRRARSMVHFGLAHSDFAAKVCVPRCFVLSTLDLFVQI